MSYTLLDTALANEPISKQCMKCLKAEGIVTYRDLVTRHRFDMLKIRNFGRKCLLELDTLLESKGLSFGMILN